MYIVINGGGKIGSYLSQMLFENGHDVVIIEREQAGAERLLRDMPKGVLVIEGDGCDSNVLLDAGIERADIFVATTGRDDDNLVSCELAKKLYDVPRCIARVNNPRNERIFRRLGVESVSSTSVISRMIEEEALASTIKTVQNLAASDLVMIEQRIQGSGVLGEKGIKVGDIELPKGAIIAAVSRKGDLEVVTHQTRLHPGDVAVVLSATALEDEVRDLLRNL